MGSPGTELVNGALAAQPLRLAGRRGSKLRLVDRRAVEIAAIAKHYDENLNLGSIPRAADVELSRAKPGVRNDVDDVHVRIVQYSLQTRDYSKECDGGKHT